MATDNARLIALQRSNGQLIWEAEIADYRHGYAAVAILMDGFEGWSALGLPLETQGESSSN